MPLTPSSVAFRLKKTVSNHISLALEMVVLQQREDHGPYTECIQLSEEAGSHDSYETCNGSYGQSS